MAAVASHIEHLSTLVQPHVACQICPGKARCSKLLPDQRPAIFRDHRLQWALLRLRLRLRRIYWPRRVLGGACPTLTLQQIAICQHAGHGNDSSCETRLHALQEGNSLPNSGVPWACAWQLP